VTAEASLEYPALYSASDAASFRAQHTHYRFLKSQLFLFLLVSISAALTPAVPVQHQQDLSLLVTLFLAAGLIMMWIARARRYEKVWFDCRAIAESVKTTAWRYSMRARPFGDDAPGNTDRALLAALHEIRQTWPGLESHITSAGDAAELTAQMRRLRASPLNERRTFYVTARVRDQRAWYASKCVLNRRRAGQWFWITLLLQAGALLLAALQVRYGMARISPISPLMTVAATAVAWSQARRHEELVQSYGLATHELRSLEALADSTTTEDAFQDYVEQAEEAISREHTMWCARRDVRLPRPT
jgi:hypothetical protein